MWRFPTISPQLSDNLTLETNFLLRLITILRLMKTSCCSAAKSWLKSVETGRNRFFQKFQWRHFNPSIPSWAPHNVLNRRREGWILRRVFDWATHPRMGFVQRPKTWRLWNYQSTELSTSTYRYLDESRLNPITIDTNLRYQPTIKKIPGPRWIQIGSGLSIQNLQLSDCGSCGIRTIITCVAMTAPYVL